ncbi:MAG: (1-_4)-alpha-D-glucan 1-alpha-D-glucosylmutase [Actinomycetota bacterium]|nr:(1->4)-alpha-D-glucan 1-alpha-D-glucosylmutase [Actinomycetota bacterium]
MSGALSPAATYRLQLRSEFGFDDAAAIADYLGALGVSHVYASPYLQAVKGSAHGYDVVDHSKVNDELGGADAHARYTTALGRSGLGQVLDIVPNHMAITSENRWWTDVLEHGIASRYAGYFDVDWDPPESRLRNRILLPVLGDHYGRVLEAGELRLARRGDKVVVTYFDRWFPLAPGTHGDDIDVLNADVDALDAVLEQQHYRLAWWRTAKDEVDYRRFFDIDSLAALRMEDEIAFEETHALVLQWLVAGELDGVRIDHIDGLRRPRQYLHWLRERAPDAYVVVEKILEPGELAPRWECDGTTGYDFLNKVTRVLVDPRGEQPFTDAYAAFTGEPVDFREIAYEKKRLVLRDVLAADLLRLTNLFVQVCENERRYRDYTRPELHAVLREAIACFPVYRTYVVPGEAVSDDDEQHIASALKEAAARRPETDAELWDLLGRILRGELSAELCLRFQQTTGPVMAKGVEDTAFYTFNRFVALNEVGGDPGRWSDDVRTFHDEMGAASPTSMLASTTHDTKRSEDVRARLLVLAEVPEKLAAAVAEWHEMNARHWGGHEPDRNLEWLLYQVLIGAHPLSTERAVQYVEKATREAKVHTSWTTPNASYDAAVRAFVEGVLADGEFTASLGAFVAPLVEPGWTNALAMQAIKLTAPGVPDIYQGTELWDLSLVDPDNRRPGDYDQRRRLLDAETHPKLRLTRAALRARPSGRYEPITAHGEAAEHVLAYRRGDDLVTVVPRLPLRLTERGGFGDTVVILPDGHWTDAVTGATVAGGSVAVSRVLGSFPVALLRTGERT